MHRRVGTSAALLGILAAFCAWALTWTLADRAAVTYGVSGDVTTLSTYQDGDVVTPDEMDDARAELVALLGREAVPMMIGSAGDGMPMIAVFDPADRASWASPIPDGESADGAVWVVRGTYADTRWSAGEGSPFVGTGQQVVGEVDAPPGGADLQVAAPLATVPLFSGNVVLGSVDPGLVDEVLAILARAGLGVQTVRAAPLGTYVVHQPFVLVTALLYGSGLICAAAAWFLALARRSREVAVRRWFGATVPVLALRWTGREMPSLVLGTALGAAATAVVIVVVGEGALTASEWTTLGTAAGVGAGLSACALTVVTFWVVARAAGGTHAR